MPYDGFWNCINYWMFKENNGYKFNVLPWPNHNLKMLFSKNRKIVGS